MAQSIAHHKAQQQRRKVQQTLEKHSKRTHITSPTHTHTHTIHTGLKLTNSFGGLRDCRIARIFILQPHIASRTILFGRTHQFYLI